jgi:beta-lactamase regulating signal transducer with metallopeptidase domain
MNGTLGSLLIPVALKGAVLLAAAAVAALALRRASAATRHLVWATAMVGLLVLPLAAAMLPIWQVPVDVPILGAASNNESTLELMDALAPAHPRSAPARTVAPSPAPAAADAPVPTVVPSAVAALRSNPSRAALWLWLVGAAAMFVHLLVGLRMASGLIRRSRTIEDERWHERLEDAAARMGVPGALLLASSETAVPVTCGIRRPVILLPPDAGTWSEERARVVLLHELGHVRRRDCLVHVVAQAARALHWFNPLAWLALGRLTAERERACDDLVLSAGTRGSAYAEHLLEIARGVRAGGSLSAALAMARPSELEGRLLAILDAARNRRPPSSWRLVTTTVVTFGLVAVLSSARLQSSAEAAVVPKSAAGELRQSDRPPDPKPTPAPTRTPTAAPAPRPAPVAAPAPPPQPPAAGAGPQLPPTPVGAPPPARRQPANRPSPPTGGPNDTQVPPVPDSVVKALVAALDDENEDVRREALQTLVRFRSPLAFDPMLAAAKSSDPEIRGHAVFALGQFGDARAVPTLTAALKDENADVRGQAAFALGRIGSADGVVPLIAALKDAAAEVRQQAAFALGQLKDPRSVDPLTAALKDADPEVRQHAAFALGQVLGR